VAALLPFVAAKRYVVHHAGGGYSRSPADLSHEPFVKRKGALAKSGSSSMAGRFGR